jgi:hypothetical protein
MKGPFPYPQGASFFYPVAKLMHWHGGSVRSRAGFQIDPDTWSGTMFRFCFCTWGC